MKILVSPTSLTRENSPKVCSVLEEFADEVVYNPYKRPLSQDEALALMDGVDGYIAGLDYITEALLDKAPASLKVISRYGVGYDRVDIKTAGKKGIIVTNTPGVNSNAVADLAFGLMMSVARKIPAADRKIRAGEWPRTIGVEMYGKTLGILGLGAIGKGVALRAKGFNMQILAYDPFMDREFVKANGIKECALDEIIAHSDFISLHLPLNDQTRLIINEDSINRMKTGVILVNTARGGLIDEQAAYKALKYGKLGGLGLDAFENEPPENSPLFEFDNVVATPHAGAHTSEATENMGMMAVRNLIDILNDKDCKYIVNKEFLLL